MTWKYEDDIFLLNGVKIIVCLEVNSTWLQQ